MAKFTATPIGRRASAPRAVAPRATARKATVRRAIVPRAIVPRAIVLQEIATVVVIKADSGTMAATAAAVLPRSNAVAARGVRRRSEYPLTCVAGLASRRRYS